MEELEKQIATLDRNFLFNLCSLPISTAPTTISKSITDPETDNLFILDKCINDFKLKPNFSIIHNNIIHPKHDYLHLRAIQNKDWAIHNVSEGISLAQKNQPEQAIKKYNIAIELDDTCIEAFIARGAANANILSYKKAISDFKKALSIDPEHPNALVYLKKTQDVYDRIESEKESARRGEFLISEDFNPSETFHDYRSSQLESLNEPVDSDEGKKHRKKHKSEKKKKKRRNRSSD